MEKAAPAGMGGRSVARSESPHAVTSLRSALMAIKARWLLLAAILAASGYLNFFRLNAEGYANSYYAAAVKSMLTSWHNFFFASFDPGGFVSVDKPPVGFWIQAASAKLFGFSGLSLLLPEAFAGVLSVALTYYLVRRVFGVPAGLVAALALALTPISVVTDRNNTIDSLLVLALLLAAWAFIIAAETGRLRWLLLGAFGVGVGFNIKMMEAFLPLPAFFLVYFLGAPVGRWKRIGHLALATVVLLAVSLSWATAVDLTPASQRPYVGSSSDNSELNLIIGYNGLDRLLPRSFSFANRAQGGTTRPSGPANPRLGRQGNQGFPFQIPDFTDVPNFFAFGSFETGAPGPLRMLNQNIAGQISWTLPLAVLGFFAAFWQSRLRRRLDRQQKGLVLWGMWSLTEIVFFSVASEFHLYYMVTMAPPIAALVGAGVAAMWQDFRWRGLRGWLLPLTLGATAALQAHILASYPDWSSRLTPLIAGLTLVSAVVLLLAKLPMRRHLTALTAARAAVVAGVAALLVAPTVWAAISIEAGPMQLPAAGPQAGRRGFGGEAMSADGALIQYLQAHQGADKFLVAVPNANAAAPIILAAGEPVMAMGGFIGRDPILTQQSLANMVAKGEISYFLLPQGRFGRGGFFGGEGNLTSWVQSHGKLVPPQEWGGTSTGRFGPGEQLYYVAPSGSGA